LGIGQLRKTAEVIAGCKYQFASDSSFVQWELKRRFWLKQATSGWA